jgi:hypothetical protein
MGRFSTGSDDSEMETGFFLKPVLATEKKSS